MKAFRLKVSIRNNLILTAMEEQGYKSIAELSRAAGECAHYFAPLVAMKEAPISKGGSFTTPAKALMEVLGAAPSDLWTEQQLRLALKQNTAERAVDEHLVQHLLESQTQVTTLASPEDACLVSETAALVDSMLDTLTPRNKQIMQLRFYDDAHFSQVSDVFDLTFQRAQQLTERNLEKLRGPYRLDAFAKSGLVSEERLEWARSQHKQRDVKQHEKNLREVEAHRKMEAYIKQVT